MKENTLGSIQRYVVDQLSQLYDEHEANNIAKLLIEKVFNISSVEFSITKNKRLSESDILKIVHPCKRLKNGEPLQYVLGEAHFFGLVFRVSPDVLIPRMETEELVNWVVKDCCNENGIKIIDVCTGSGCIATALSKGLNISITGVDVSNNALKMAKFNADVNGAEVNFFKADVLKESGYLIDQNVVVCNPPYVLNSEKSQMHKNVLEFEPHLALFVEDNDPLLFYKKVIEDSIKSNSVKNVYFEINPLCVNKLEGFLKQKEIPEYTFKEDLNGKVRMLKISI